MKNTTLLSSSMSLAVPSPRPGPRLPSLFVAIAMLLLLLSIASSTYADSATWKSSPATGDWNTAANWTPMTVPNGPSDTATFATSNRTAVSLSAYTEVNGIVFNAGASAFTITVSPANLGRLLTISGVGITNDSGVIQHFVTASGPGILDFGEFSFSNSATAGSETVYTNSGDGHGIPAQIGFGDSSNAGNGIFINEGGAPAGDQGGVTFFVDHATAANGPFINNGAAVRNAPGGLTIFFGGTAEDATLIANGGPNKFAAGKILFFYRSKGGKARVELFGNGELDISDSVVPGMRVGSIEGDGDILLGSRNLEVGSNGLSTNFSGVIKDGGEGGGVGGSLTKVGMGKLVLSHRNTYTGGTTIKRGKLMVNNIGGSGTGSGPVQVDGGWLGGKGIIAGAVMVGTGSGSGAVLAPGYVHGLGSPDALTIQSALTFSVDATYNVDVHSSNATADEVGANGVTLN